jgi:GH25 family lysozyme M1 (1,4-beta-N-acetylmuramidase)
MVYTNTNWLEWAKEFVPPKGVPIWQAHYGRADHPNGAKIWQYTDKGDVDGIYGNVDMNEGIDIIGDANGDGKVNLADASVMMKHIAGHKGTKIDEGQADINDDGYVTLSDVSAVLRRIAGHK